MARRIESWKYAKSSNTCIPICCFLHKINMKSLKLVAFAHQSKLVIREDPISVTWFLDTCCCIDAMSRHWTCHAISGLLLFTDIILGWQTSTAGIQCQICYMTFSDQSTISAHYDTAHAQSGGSRRPEHPDARHECEVCGRKFTQKKNLKLHLSTFHGVGDAESFQCAVCSYVTKRRGDLKKHLSRVHRT